jgi:hypothetical protein
VLAKGARVPPSTPCLWKAYFAQYHQNTHRALNDVEDAATRIRIELSGFVEDVGVRALRACGESIQRIDSLKREIRIALGPVRLHAVGLTSSTSAAFRAAASISLAAAPRSAATIGSCGRWLPSRRSRYQCTTQRCHAASRKNFAAPSDKQTSEMMGHRARRVP